jgi:hypothetical protein
MDEHDDLNYIINIYKNEPVSEQNKYIIVTGGIGDFIALDYLYNFSKLNNIIFISKQSLTIKKLLNNVDYFKLLNNENFQLYKNKYFSVYFDFKIINKPGFNDLNEIIKHIPLVNEIANIKVINISDYFPYIKKNINNFYLKSNIYGSKIVSKKIILDIKDKFCLPDNIVFINPYTEDNRVNCIKCNIIHSGINKCRLTRNFLNTDYENIYNFLKNNNLFGVIISSKEIIVPSEFSNLFINLSCKTTLLESIEILKVCNYYIGIDGLFSIVASKIFSEDKIFIKSNNKHLYENSMVYYFPKNKVNINSFIKI